MAQTHAQITAARATALLHMDRIIQQYRRGETLAELCALHEVGMTWLKQQFDDRGVTIRRGGRGHPKMTDVITKEEEATNDKPSSLR
ncbi:hypothetical protein AB0O64_09790 [Streptomyces sp. NPDC088341]|uniref:hypothetical protein n=1 Tax=Streptomyces sp. NPDC088341 TaxID=3154870 RepID=UPI0034393C38